METPEKDNFNVSRRDFLKKAAVGAGVVAGSGILASCAPKTVSQTGDNGDATATGSTVEGGLTAASSEQKWAFEIAPDPIPDSQIGNTVTADIIIVGSGHAGLTCANSAAENGAKVVLISASSAPVYRGGSMHAAYSKVMEQAGIDRYDVDRFFRRELSEASYNVDQDKWWKFYNNSEEAMNWLIDKMEAAGYTCVLEAHNSEPNDGPMDVPAGSHSFISADMTEAGSGAQFTADTLAKTAQDAGVQIIYKTVAEQLVRDDNNTGRVSAVIAKGEDGTYTKYVGTKAIVLATGDFSANPDMMAKYCSWAVPTLSTNGDQGYDTDLKIGGLYKGDGQRMGLWVGAAWQKTFPAAPMILIGAGGAGLPSTQPYGAHRGLIVNKNGYRYGNEDVNGSFAGIAMMRQPEMKAYAIWDSNYAEAAAPWFLFGMKVGDDPVAPADMIQRWEDAVTKKTMFKADTIEGIIDALGLPADATKATVDRYNSFCESGADDDYHKRKELLIPIKQGPFYGSPSDSPTFLSVLGGLRTNLDMQVCDENDTPIPGLFNIGTMVGDYYANCYNFNVQGNNLGGNCLTFGYLTGKAIAQGTI